VTVVGKPQRVFHLEPGVRAAVPLWVGIMGPSGSGKTFSALRLATGIQQVAGGDICVIDTEARRALHYADNFRFKHMQFDPPHSSLDYLSAIQHCVKIGAGVIVIDSMSHEHTAMLEYHERELDRLAGMDLAKRERVKLLAWQKPKAARRELIDQLLQMRANFVFCFRARETVKPVKVDGKTELVPQGFTPIAGDEFVFEQTVCCLLLPHANGVPTWESEFVGERTMMKLPLQFQTIFAQSRPLSSEIGIELAKWAMGDTVVAADAPVGELAPAAQGAPAGAVGDDGQVWQNPRTPELSALLMQWDTKLGDAAKVGATPEERLASLAAMWKKIPAYLKPSLVAAKDRRHKPTALGESPLL
jgi:ABC-type oligopeptide transport system ATPase subunit